MKLTKEVLAVLNNFSGINSNIYIEPGNKIITMLPNKSVFAEYKFDEDINDSIGIFDLGRFLKVVSLMGDNPEVHWSADKVRSGDLSRYLEIRADGRRVRYMQSERSMLKVPSNALPDLEGNIAFTFTEEHRNLLMKAGNVLSCNYIAFFNKGSDIYAKTFDPDEDSAVMDDYEVMIAEGAYTGGEVFHLVFQFGQIPTYKGNYDVVITDYRDGGISAAQFKHDSGKLGFWITMVNEHSTIEGA